MDAPPVRDRAVIVGEQEAKSTLDGTTPMNASGGPDMRLFETEHLRGDLGGRSVRGAVVTMLGQAGNFVVQLAGTALLARLLVPEDFGVFGKTIALTGFITVVRDGGLALATIQRAHITHEQISNLFWLNLLLGLLTAALIGALSPVMAWFYHDPRVFWIGLALAGASIISSLSVQHAALLQRQMRFGAITLIGTIGMLVGFASAIAGAWHGVGVWALAVQQYAIALTTALLLFATCRWRPGLPRRGTGVRPMLRIGVHQTGFGILNFASRNVDNVLIGRFVSDAALGLYTQAYRLLLLPIQQINSPISGVVVPALSRLQDQPERYARYYYRAIGAIVLAGMPIVGFLVVDAKPVIQLVLGPVWLPTVPIFQALGLAAFLGTFNVAGGWVYTSLGRTDRQFRWQLVSTPAIVLSFVLGLPWGAVGVAWAFSGMCLILVGPALHYCFRGTPISLGRFGRAIARPSLAAIGAAGATVAARLPLSAFPGYDRYGLTRLLVDGAVYVSAYLLACAASGGWGQVRDILRLGERGPGDR
jgi:O-antigen/teichoic acid export membrane protein